MRTTAILLAHACALAFGTYHTFRPTFDSRFERIQTERGDGMLNHLILENSWLALTEPNYCGTLATPPFYYPEPGTLAYSENLFGSAPIYWALRTVTNHEFAYIWWQIICTALNFVAFAVVARWLRMWPAVAVAGAFLWAFATVHADQMKHSQMIPRFFMPFAAYYAIALVLEPSARALNRMLGAVFFQCLACVYTGWFLAVGLAVFLPVLVALSPGAARNLWQYTVAHKWRVLGTVLFWALAMAALFVPYIVVNRGVSRTYEECHGFFPTPEAWVTGPQGSRWHETLAQVREPAPFECLLFSGFVVYGLMLAAIVHLPFFRRGSKPALWAVALAGLITALAWALLTLATSQTGESLWRVVRHVPGGGAIRVVSRIYVTVYLFGTIGALLWLSMLLDRIRGAWTRAAILVPLLAVLVWEQTGFVPDNFDRRDFYPIVEQNADMLRGADAGYIVPRFVDTRGKGSFGPYGEVFGMWVGMRANVPVLNGYSGRGPNDFPLTGALTDDDIKGWLKGKFRGTVRVIDSEAPGQYRTVVIE
ncbi:hypothetical protein J8F10_09475 [Gemmata sp. G18]|uniref:Glycosyltransferase RgtA/B/C/D-like domain-containing protein n=1 Tax=Gemmata palustris TaxID=2822762 RepID=A0ABS5BPC6_9BACT|nr:hypothetical protein [Gemmata palustris]MBP3955511.1 hypothetical protein [Gemmata palustris]